MTGACDTLGLLARFSFCTSNLKTFRTPTYMATTVIGAREVRPARFWESTNGKKVVMAVSGVVLFAFVLGHMVGNLQAFEGAEKTKCLWAFSARGSGDSLGRSHRPAGGSGTSYMGGSGIGVAE